jgi:hypothetical protein
MKYLFGLAILLVCSGCATRSITFIYYPLVANPEAFDRDAEKECAKYEMKPILMGEGLAGFGRSSKMYQCVPK